MNKNLDDIIRKSHLHYFTVVGVAPREAVEKATLDLAGSIRDAGWVHESEIKICKFCNGYCKGLWKSAVGICPDCHGKGWVRKEAKA